jgi:hypothetical protein
MAHNRCKNDLTVVQPHRIRAREAVSARPIGTVTETQRFSDGIHVIVHGELSEHRALSKGAGPKES